MIALAAVDLGATSARVCRVEVDDPSAPIADARLQVVNRVPHEAVRHPDGSLRWDWEALLDAVDTGLGRAASLGHLDSIGVDTWGVDYGLLDADGTLVAPPHAYRSDRTARFRTLVERVGERRLYELGGIQLQPFTTLFQLAAHVEQHPDELHRAERLAFLPDLVGRHLTGVAGPTDLTFAATTGLLAAGQDDWHADLVAASGIDPGLLPEVARPGGIVGSWRDVPVVRVGGHDTASATAAAPVVGDDVVFLATGTWLLVGVTVDGADTSPEAQAANLTNERAVDGRVRVLKNLTGFWMVEELRRQLAPTATAADLCVAAAARPDPGVVVDVTGPGLLAPPDMAAELRRLADGRLDTADLPALVRVAVESMAAAVADTIAGPLAPHLPRGAGRLAVVGGGVHVPLLLDALRRRTGLDVVVGASEATALGNAATQLLRRIP